MPSVYTVSREQFELRMRARRAATCLAIARSAVASGRILDAIDRLEEACALDPGAGEARLLLEDLRSQEPAAAGAPPEVRVRSEMGGWSHWIAAGIAICALAALAFFWPSSPPGTAGSADPAREMPASPASDPPAATGTGPAPGLAVQDLQMPRGDAPAVDTAGAAEPSRPDAPAAASGGSVAIEVSEQPVIQRPLPILPASGERSGGTAAPESGTATSAPLDAGRSQASPAGPAPAAQGAAARLPALQGANPSATPPGAGAVDAVSGSSPAPAARTAAPQLPPLERVPVVDEAPVRAVPVPEGEPPAGARQGDAAEASLRIGASNEAGAIEGTLRRYADAYARLDAAAAQKVWPTVDQRALARAFDGLESQGIVFERCDVTVSGDDAMAACNGRARYVPKVGSREPLVERRQWTFRLRKAEAGWQITQADAR